METKGGQKTALLTKAEGFECYLFNIIHTRNKLQHWIFWLDIREK